MSLTRPYAAANTQREAKSVSCVRFGPFSFSLTASYYSPSFFFSLSFARVPLPTSSFFFIFTRMRPTPSYIATDTPRGAWPVLWRCIWFDCLLWQCVRAAAGRWQPCADPTCLGPHPLTSPRLWPPPSLYLARIISHMKQSHEVCLCFFMTLLTVFQAVEEGWVLVVGLYHSGFVSSLPGSGRRDNSWKKGKIQRKKTLGGVNGWTEQDLLPSCRPAVFTFSYV